MSIGTLPNVNSTKTNRDIKQGISVCSRTTMLTKHQIESRKKLRFPKWQRKRRQECSGYCESCISDGFCLARLGVVGFSKRQISPENPMQKVLGPIRRIPFTQSTQRQASIREKKRPSLGKIQVEIPHQRSPYAMKFEDRSQEETARQQRCARTKAWNLAKNIFKLKQNDKATFFSPAEKCFSQVPQQDSRRRENL